MIDGSYVLNRVSTWKKEQWIGFVRVFGFVFTCSEPGQRFLGLAWLANSYLPPPPTTIKSNHYNLCLCAAWSD